MELRKAERYDNTTIFFHWLTVLLVCLLFGIGWYMIGIPKGTPERSWFFALHKSIGLTVVLVALLRLTWRVTHATPPPMPELPDWQRLLASTTHNLLYLFLIIQPLTGYISSSFSGYKTRFWGIALPHWGWKDQGLNELFTEFHVVSSLILIGLILLHISGALTHVIIPQENIMRRMWPVFRGKLKR